MLKRTRNRGPLPLNGKVVIVTGASSGIGRATAHAFAAEGAKIVMAARREEVLREVQAELAIYQAESLVVPTDVTQDADLHRLVDATQEAYGRLDVLVNNAGLTCGGPHHQIDPARLRTLLDVNLYGPLRLTQIVLPVMLRQEPADQGLYGEGVRNIGRSFRGHIVNIASTAGTISGPGVAAYSATRRGVIRFSAALRREVAGTGVRVSAICPTWTETPILATINEAKLRAVGGLFPGENMHRPELPARAIVDAVQFDRPFVNLGGWMMRIGRWTEALAPALTDFHWRVNVNTEDYITLMEEFND